MQNRAGFTLIEILMAVTILVIVLTGTAKFAAMFTREMTNSSVRLVATGVATGQLELIRADPRYAQLVTLYNGNDTLGFPGYPTMRRWTTVVRADPPRDRTTITVRVAAPALRDTVAVTTVVAAP